MVKKEVSYWCDILGFYIVTPVHESEEIWSDSCGHLALSVTIADAQSSFLVFHGGSGSSKEEIKEAVTNGVIKMNVDTDTQVSCWSRTQRWRLTQ